MSTNKNSGSILNMVKKNANGSSICCAKPKPPLAKAVVYKPLRQEIIDYMLHRYDEEMNRVVYMNVRKVCAEIAHAHGYLFDDVYRVVTDWRYIHPGFEW
jgi:hypothetical protein